MQKKARQAVGLGIGYNHAPCRLTLTPQEGVAFMVSLLWGDGTSALRCHKDDGPQPWLNPLPEVLDLF